MNCNVTMDVVGRKGYTRNIDDADDEKQEKEKHGCVKSKEDSPDHQGWR